MAWRPNQRINISDAPPPVKNSPAAEPNTVNLPKETHAGKKVGENRAHNVRRDKDKIKDFSITLLDVDTTVIDHLDKTISPTVLSEGTQKKVPVMFGSPERWKAVQKDGVYRDQRGRIQLPLIMVKRNTIQRNDDLITFNRHLNMPFQRKYSNKNQYDRFSVMNNLQKPVHETYNVSMPDHVIVTYEFMVWTDTVEQNNNVIEKINWNTEDYWGDERRFKFRTSISDYNTQTEVSDGDTRLVRATFQMQVYAYLLNDTFEDWKSTTQKAFTPRKVVFGVELDEDEIPEKYPKGEDPDDYWAYYGVKNLGGVDVVEGLDNSVDTNSDKPLVIRDPIPGGFGGYIRLYGDASAFNRSIYELQSDFELNGSALVHESSSAYANQFTSSVEFVNSYNLYEVSKFTTSPAMVNVTSSMSGSSNIHQQMIQWDSSWTSPSFGDGSVIVTDNSFGIEYNFDNVSYNPTTKILTSGDANMIKDVSGFPVDYRTYVGSFSGSRDSGIQYGSGLIRADEIQSGSIHHAVSMRVPEAHETFVNPAVNTIGSGSIPMGTRFFLNINDTTETTWLDSLSGSINRNAARTVVSALRDYGWVVTDTSTNSSNQIDFEGNGSNGDYWNDIGFSGSLFTNMLGNLFTTDNVIAVKDLNYTTIQ